ncbi:hypothetical protein BC938DRAFT_480889 [Jimgerdemannia flammicorona]|uniref:F-box domain-containing protein n=1 Tax=Jimgerdemannia flammicorona TaxID=994334 RepID=A0A433QHF5_9FUNG|nr:hypothetical protein BC938DRAFT_480889 [Jimgerdemannia flammicorona]
MPLTALSYELLCNIFRFLREPKAFSRTCRLFRTLSHDPYAIAVRLIEAHTLAHVFWFAIVNHSAILTLPLSHNLANMGALVPRCLVQGIARDLNICLPENKRPRVRLSYQVQLFLLQRAMAIYGTDSSWLLKNDWDEIVGLLRYVPHQFIPCGVPGPYFDLEGLRRLIIRTGFVPLPFKYGCGDLNRYHTDFIIYLLYHCPSAIDLLVTHAHMNIDHFIHRSSISMFSSWRWIDATIEQGLFSHYSPDLIAAAVCKLESISAAVRLDDDEVIHDFLSCWYHHTNLMAAKFDVTLRVRGFPFLLRNAKEVMESRFGWHEMTCREEWNGMPMFIPLANEYMRLFHRIADDDIPLFHWLLRLNGPNHLAVRAAFSLVVNLLATSDPATSHFRARLNTRIVGPLFGIIPRKAQTARELFLVYVEHGCAIGPRHVRDMVRKCRDVRAAIVFCKAALVLAGQGAGLERMEDEVYRFEFETRRKVETAAQVSDYGKDELRNVQAVEDEKVEAAIKALANATVGSSGEGGEEGQDLAGTDWWRIWCGLLKRKRWAGYDQAWMWEQDGLYGVGQETMMLNSAERSEESALLTAVKRVLG